MAIIDTSFYSKMVGPDITGNIAEGLRLKDLANERMLKQKKSELEQKQFQQEQDERDAVKKAILVDKDGNITLSKATLAGLAKLNPEKAMELESKFQARDSGALRQKLNHAKMTTDFLASQLPNVKDQASWTALKQRAMQMGLPGVENEPDSFDPNYAQNLTLRTLSAKDRLDQMWKEKDFGPKKEEVGIKRHEAEAKNQRMGAYTKGQEQVDKDYAKHYNTFTQKGAVNVKTAIDRLEALASEMEKDKGFGEAGGGRFASVLPDALRSRDAIRRRDQARNFANTTLKELFGGQLSDAEREAAAKEYYNDALGNAENAKILRDKIAQLKDAYNTELAKAQHYEREKTLSNFSGASQLKQISKGPPDSDKKTFKTNEIEWAD